MKMLEGENSNPEGAIQPTLATPDLLIYAFLGGLVTRVPLGDVCSWYVKSAGWFDWVDYC